MNLSRRSALLFVLLAAMPIVAAAREYINPKFSSAELTVRTVLLLPAEVQLTKVGIKGSEGMAKESEDLAAKITAVIIERLKQRGVNVLPNAFTEEALKNNEEMQATLTKLQNKYNTLATQLHRSPKDVKKGRFTLTDEVATLGPAAQADAIVFVRASGSILTGGKKAFGILVAGAKSNTIQTYLSIVDSKTGNVLAVVTLARAGGFQTKTDKAFGKGLTNSFKKMQFSTK